MSRTETPEILIFGSASCMSSQWVMQELHSRGASYHFVDFQDFERSGAGVSFHAGPGSDGLAFEYLAQDLKVTTERVKSAYFREVSPKHALWHLDPLRLKQLDAPEAEKHRWEQVLRFSSSVLEYLAQRCFCLYPKAPSGQASNKLKQLALARDLGFRVPETYVGNDLEEMRAFVREVGDVISKPFFPQNLFYEGYNYKTFTSRFTLEDLEPFADTRYPVTLQQAITPKTDIRVGIVGRKVFATEIGLRGDDRTESIVDFRHFLVMETYDRRVGAEYRIHELPPEIRERCQEFVRVCGLQYSMMDLLQTPDGEYVFLENNTKGMHGEVEFGGHRVMEAIADLLMDPEANKMV